VARELDSKGLDSLRVALTEMGVGIEKKDGTPPLFDAELRTPLFDALDLIDIGTGLNDEEQEQEKEESR
jgi:hypothetical protein